MKTKLSPSKAIAAFCKTCIYDPGGGNGSWINQVEDCTAPLCPLFEHRPLTDATKDVLREERISRMNPQELAKYRAKQEAARIRMTEMVGAEKTDKTNELFE